MKLDHMFKKIKNSSSRRKTADRPHRPEVPEGLLKKCNKCGKPILTEEVKKQLYICPECGGYFRIHARRRVEMITDPGSFEAWGEEILSGNPLQYRGYEEKIRNLQELTGLSEAILIGKGKIGGREAVIGVCDSRFLMASMGWAAGERIATAVERATKEKLPVILFACSGGARMQEGITSLMQMAKTAAAFRRHSAAGLLYISVLTDPTMGGVTASFAMLGDIILAEPDARIGFAGPRVIEQTIGQKLPKGFQRSEFLLEHGFLDGIVERADQKKVLQQLLDLHADDPSEDRRAITGEETVLRKKSADPEDPWTRVLRSRRKDRPVADDYISRICEGFTELHGDRLYGEDPAVIGGIGKINGIPVTVIAQAKGRDTKENIRRNFGMPSPEGYRKAQRLMKQAEKFHRPVICLVDTPGAFCGLEAEERGQGEAIARTLYDMAALKTPVLAILIGEGGSGGALALAAADEVWMLENSTYSILSPEGFASILWKDSTKVKKAAELMGLTAERLREQRIVERVFEEPEHYTEETMDPVICELEDAIAGFIDTYMKKSEEGLLNHRYERFRNL